jgi:hypothetical protein
MVLLILHIIVFMIELFLILGTEADLEMKENHRETICMKRFSQ